LTVRRSVGWLAKDKTLQPNQPDPAFREHSRLLNIDTISNVVFDPVLLSPFNGVDLDAIDLHRKVKMIAGGYPVDPLLPIA
jgi:hypothetical protein